MPFDNTPAAPAPTRRSSRIRSAAFEAPAAGATAAVSEAAAPAFEAPLSRRAARQRFAPTVIPEASEPIVEAEPVVEAGPSASAAPAVDAFEEASRAFRAVVSEAVPAPEPAEAVAEAEAPVVEHVAPRRPRPRLRKAVTLGATVGVMGLAGLLTVSMTLPAEAVAAGQGPQAFAATSLVAASGASGSDRAEGEIQAFVTSSDVQNSTLVRSDSFSTVSLIQVAAEEGIDYSNEVFTNDPDAAIQWPFKVGVGMSSGYGMRWGRLHEGIDFVPGEGAPIQAIADGTVRIATEQGGAYGVTVYIDHVIDGQVVTSHYSHMQYGSLQVQAGQTVKVGDIVGKTGNTGRSYGAHLHFEIIVNGGTIDPMPWLRENAGRYSY
ncbi:M23 family metallopeptidase [Microbacterium hydrocarbonoxydans]|uniref:M23 family metallopeptidase n=1 Tax=Microbacterium hydrocarbonoxydans TaxID=273678 RepID=UPI0013DBA397|nr:M23 family metallopeptidase [Microbacterium hydrocarbonoxydans]